MSECPYCKDKPDEKDAQMHPYGGSCMHVRWDISPWGSGHCLPPFGDDSYGERSAEGEWLGAHYLSVCRTEHWVHFAIVSDAGGPPSAVARVCRDCAATLGAFLTDENRPKERCRDTERNIAAMLERMRRDAERAAGADVDGRCRFLAETGRCGRSTTDGSRWCAAHVDLWVRGAAHAAGLWRFPEVLYGDVVDFRPPMPVSADEMRQWAKGTADLLRLGFGAMDEKEARRWSTPPSL